jgi:hypothetical protein
MAMGASTLRSQPAPANNRRCARCGLINFAEAEACRRCKSSFETVAVSDEPAESERSVSSRVARRLLWIAGMIVLIVFIWSRSLVLTSEPITEEQRLVVMQAVAVLARAGFSREVVMLRNFANYRATDNWWNRYQGHQEAYAATNFPLGVVTLYGPFFTVATDDTERAAILLHEAQHLFGAGEEETLQRVWDQKDRIGWTADRYGATKVWKNTKEWTESVKQRRNTEAAREGHAAVPAERLFRELELAFDHQCS